MNNLDLDKAAKFTFFKEEESLENAAKNRVDVQYNDDVDVEYNDEDIDSSKEDSATAESKQISEEITGKYKVY